MPNPTESVDVGQDEHTYGPEQVDEFGRALIQPGVPCTVSRDEDGELVYEFDARRLVAPTRT
jgi:hypothetical protein